jgi:DNA-binding transcriptional regulator YiaG
MAAPSTAHGQLREWIDKNSTPTVFAAAMAVTRQMVHKWLNGECRPSSPKRARIEVLTGIPLESWSTPAERLYADGID